MTRCRLVTAATTILIGISLVMAAHAATPRSLIAKVDRVTDGDSVTAITSDGTKLRIRLLGIDAPEIANGVKPGQSFGEEAREYLDQLIEGKTVRVDAYGPDALCLLGGSGWRHGR